eukprot:TRINITY_DN4159_c0_g1_i1.p2 TRINITY_DN4159_c0_g1~~TRINITY_DN4159_c0_g1_i1.p2  ORF type:complete len:63 (-),score=7.33 TRINITY_DN4159_c0_g1_i1:209-370(-)
MFFINACNEARVVYIQQLNKNGKPEKKSNGRLAKERTQKLLSTSRVSYFTNEM